VQTHGLTLDKCKHSSFTEVQNQRHFEKFKINTTILDEFIKYTTLSCCLQVNHYYCVMLSKNPAVILIFTFVTCFPSSIFWSPSLHKSTEAAVQRQTAIL
jgi:hypothetical protein